MITQRDLVDRLSRRNLGAWSVIERVQDLALADELRSLQRRDHRTRITLIVHHDLPRGRGSARLDLDPVEASTDDLIDQAVQLATTAVGPTWSSTPPAAPAKVNLVDDDLLQRGLDAVALSTLAHLRRPPDLTVAGRTQVLRENVTVVASSGFHTSWLATALRTDILLATGAPPPTAAAPSAAAAPRSLALSRFARRIDDLDLDTTVADAATDLRHIAAAGPPAPGPCALWLGPEALLHPTGPDDDHGLWAIFAHQADSAIERQGLTRYRLRAEIAPGAASLPEPLSILSNGALDFATRSSPVSDDAVAIRRFPLIERGIAVGLGLSPREAAFRHTEPNGGVRNLIISPGTWSAVPSATARTIEVRRLHAASLDLTTGDATLDIALGFDHRPNHPEPTTFTGGTVHLDLITALALARRSSQLLQRGAYRGPASLLIDSADLLA